MSTESASRTSGPPPASSWATPPEFYTDENTVTRSAVACTGLGYTVHTPPELYGSREAALGAVTRTGLPRVGRRGWTVLGRDLKIYERPAELAAYRARLQVFLLPGEASSRARLTRRGEPGTDLRHRIDTAARTMASYPQRAAAPRDNQEDPEDRAVNS